jgi:hypothetical protein
MHSFHQSRGRILFEAFCALAISASCIGAWTDLGTLAFVPAAAVSAVYGLVRLFDLRGRRPTAAVAFAEASVAGEIQGDLLAYVPAAQSEPVVELWPVTDDKAVLEPEIAQPVKESAPKPVAKKPARTRRKKPVEVAPVLAEAIGVARIPVAEPAAETNPVEPEVSELYMGEEATHAPVAPLFEPEPFVRQQRTVFGRKAG